MVLAQREQHYLRELEESTARLADPKVCDAIARLLARTEMEMRPGMEEVHLKELLRSATYRGSEVRHFAQLGPETDHIYELPYLALRWHWQTVLAIPWKQQHRPTSMNLSFPRWRCSSSAELVPTCASTSGSSMCWTPWCLEKQLNQVLRKCTAVLLAMDDYMFPLWTISRLNFADRPSRLYEEKA